MLQVVSPSIWLPSMQIVWGVLTFWWVSMLDYRFNKMNGVLKHKCRTQCSASENLLPLYPLQISFIPLDICHQILPRLVDWPMNIPIWLDASKTGIAESSTFVGTHYILGSYVSFGSCARSIINISCYVAGISQENSASDRVFSQSRVWLGRCEHWFYSFGFVLCSIESGSQAFSKQAFTSAVKVHLWFTTGNL